MCRAYSIVNLGIDKNYIKIDEDYQEKLKVAYKLEYE